MAYTVVTTKISRKYNFGYTAASPSALNYPSTSRLNRRVCIRMIRVFAEDCVIHGDLSPLLTGKQSISLVLDSMYDFGRPLQRLCILTVLQGFTCGVFAGGNQTVETFHIVEDVSFQGEYFSAAWVKQYSGGAPGCKLGRGSYTWRPHGLGSNINSEYLRYS